MDPMDGFEIPVPPITPSEIYIFDVLFEAMSKEHRQILCLRDGQTLRSMDEIAAILRINVDEMNKRYEEAAAMITDRVTQLFIGLLHHLESGITPEMHPCELAWASERWHKMPDEYKAVFVLDRQKGRSVADIASALGLREKEIIALQTEIEQHLKFEAGALSTRVLYHETRQQ